MAYQQIKRNSGLFTPEVSDEINASVNNIDKAIDALDIASLDYKYPTYALAAKSDNVNITIGTNASFQWGSAYVVNLTLNVKTDFVSTSGGKALHFTRYNLAFSGTSYATAITSYGRRVVFELKDRNIIFNGDNFYAGETISLYIVIK